MFNRRHLLMGGLATLGLPLLTRSRAVAAGDSPNLIVIIAEGGWDVTYVFDSKLSLQGSDSPIEGPEVDESEDPNDREALATFGGLSITENRFKRPAVSTFFEKWGSYSHIVNGIWTGSIAHDPCRYRILTGTPEGTRPDTASIVGFEKGADLPLGSIDLSGWSISGPLAASSGRIGHSSQLAALIDESSPFRAPARADFTYPQYTPDNAANASIDQFLKSRAESFRQLHSTAKDHHHLDNFIDSLGRANQFKEQASSILGRLSVGKSSTMLQQTDMAADLIKGGICKTVTIDTHQAWDTHEDNILQHDMYEITFRALDNLATRLEQEGLLANTIVAVVSEMTRSPLRNLSQGKDHWGHTSAFFFGGPIAGNKMSGATDELLESLPMDLQTGEVYFNREEGMKKGALCKYDNVMAGLLELLDVDPAGYLPNVTPYRGLHR